MQEDVLGKRSCIYQLPEDRRFETNTIKQMKKESQECLNLILPKDFKTQDPPKDTDLVKKLAEELNLSLNTLRPDFSLITIPSMILSANPLQDERFPHKSGEEMACVDILNTKLFQQKLKELDDDKYSSELYVRGPRGVGKSHLLAMYVLLLRKNPNNCVLYVNNPELGIKKFNDYLANEIMYCFSRNQENVALPPNVQEDPKKSRLDQWCDYLKSGVQPTEVMKCINEFRKPLLQNEDKKLIFVIDKANVVCRHKNVQNIVPVSPGVEFFSGLTWGNNFDRLIMSASDNNEGYKTLPINNKSTNYFTSVFTEDDCLWFLYKELNDLNILNFPIKDNNSNFESIPDWRDNSEYNLLKSIIESSGCSPYELSTLVKFIKETYNNKKESNVEIIFEAHLKSRIQYYHKSYDNYMTKLNNDQKSKAYQVSTVAGTGCPQDMQHDTYDHNLIYEEQFEKGLSIYYEYKPVCPSAIKAMEYYNSLTEAYVAWRQAPIGRAVMGDVLKHILNNPKEYNNSLRDHVLEKLVIDSLSATRFSYKPIRLDAYKYNQATQTATGGDKLYLYGYINNQEAEKHNASSLQLTNIKYFEKNALANTIWDEVKDCAQGKQILFVPYTSNYSLVDCILMTYVPEDSGSLKFNLFLTLIQVTMNINEHDSRGDNLIDDHYRNNQICNHEICQTLISLQTIIHKQNIETALSEDPKKNIKIVMGYQFVWMTFANDKNVVDFKKIHRNSYVVIINQKENNIL